MNEEEYTLAAQLFDIATQLLRIGSEKKEDDKKFSEPLINSAEKKAFYPYAREGKVLRPDWGRIYPNSVLIAPKKKEDQEMKLLINQPGASVSKKPRSDGRFQGYVTDENGSRRYFYGRTKSEVIEKITEYFNPKKEKRKVIQAIPKTFNAFSQYFFENFRKRKVVAATFKADISRYNIYLKSAFGETPLKDILPLDCQKILDDIKSAGKGKTEAEVYSLMSVIFKAAIKHGIMQRNPLDMIYHEEHVSEHGSALSSEEEAALFSALEGSECCYVFAIMLYAGLRPNELKKFDVRGDFIVSVNSKRKNRKIVYKRIPITKKLRPFMDLSREIPTYEKMRLVFKKIFPDRKMYDLRTTFYTRCRECGVASAALNEFMGHGEGELATAYTDLSDDFLLREAEKIDY